MAAARAFGSFVYREEGILDDPYAERFLGPRYAFLYRLVRRAGLSALDLALASAYDLVLPGSVGWVLTRHRYFDDRVAEAARGGVEQVVVVGAGYDSRALRQKELAGLRVIEVDHPDTQARKKRILREVLGKLPENVTYLALDATRGDLRKLPEHGYDRTKRAIFAVEGFLWYMPPRIARDILSAIREIAAPGSQVVFDHILPSVVDGTCRLEGAERHRRYCARRGEPILWGIDPAGLGAFLGEIGLRLVSDVDSAELRRRYTAGGRRDIKVYPFLRIAHAEAS
jgi:methyltransferase (TIGR00027 family)